MIVVLMVETESVNDLHLYDKRSRSNNYHSSYELQGFKNRYCYVPCSSGARRRRTPPTPIFLPRRRRRKKRTA